MKHVLIAMIVFLFSANPAIAQNDERADTTFKLGSRWLLELDPNDQPYPDYLADPRRPRMQVGIGAINSNIPKTSSGRVMLDLGTRYTLFKIQTDPTGENEFALDIEGGLFMQFDPANALDNVGWDGRFGIFAVWDWSDKVVARIGYRHISAHLGDEYIEETGQERVGYTREDLAFGFGYFINEAILVYVEPSWAFHMGYEERQERWALEGGIQYQGPRNIWNDSTAFYLASHVRTFEETSWDPGISVQTGFHITRDQHASNMRIGLEGYVGRGILGEFAFGHYEAYLTMGFFFDFY